MEQLLLCVWVQCECVWWKFCSRNDERQQLLTALLRVGDIRAMAFYGVLCSAREARIMTCELYRLSSSAFDVIPTRSYIRLQLILSLLLLMWLLRLAKCAYVFFIAGRENTFFLLDKVAGFMTNWVIISIKWLLMRDCKVIFRDWKLGNIFTK